MSTQSLIPSKRQPPADEEAQQEQAKIAELRHLLVGTDRELAVRLKPHLDKIEPKDLSRVLPTAIRLRSAQDHVLTDALMPTVAAALKIAVKRDPQAVAVAIFPIMAPAIRQAIATTFSQLVQSLDKALEYSLSWQGLKWRFEAQRTGKSFAEVVLYHTLLYRVEYVFLIHRATGLLLQHVSRDGAEGNNAEVISGMMSAIKSAWQDFMHDSFGNAPDSFLSELRVGDFNIWFEQGPDLILACVIRGSAPHEFRTDFMVPAIDAIHREHADEIARFEGDPDPFVTTRHRLESCQQSRYHSKDEPKPGFRLSPYLAVPVILVLLVLGAWAFIWIRDSWRWQDYLTRL
ncbi:MAG: OmpA family protein, partial [Acidobacteriota bacterium]